MTATMLRAVARYTAHAMYAYTRRVSKEERERVAQELIKKYPILKSPNKERPYVSSEFRMLYNSLMYWISMHAFMCRIRWLRR